VKRTTPADLVKEAVKASRLAYAPYSKYRVGAAILASDGTIFRGCNVENASYGLTVCAERTALLSAVAAGKRKFKAIAIAARGKLPSPCGACRQVLSEFCAPGFSIYIASADKPGRFRRFTLKGLLPLPFRA
jgi:cytidine deaminase